MRGAPFRSEFRCRRLPSPSKCRATWGRSEMWVIRLAFHQVVDQDRFDVLESEPDGVGLWSALRDRCRTR